MLIAQQTLPFASEPAAVRLGLIHSFVAALEGIGGWMKNHAPEIDIVMRASAWSQAARQADSGPNVLLVDFQNLAGPLLAVRIAAARARGAAVVVWGERGDDGFARELLEAGASSVLGKSSSLGDAREAVIKAAERGPNAAAPSSLQPGSDVRSIVAAANTAALTSARLTEADIEAVRLYANGHSPVDIALRMNVRFERVRDHLARVREHYESQGRRAANRLDLVQRASEDGLLDL